MPRDGGEDLGGLLRGQARLGGGQEPLGVRQGDVKRTDRARRTAHGWCFPPRLVQPILTIICPIVKKL
jgi:hypothetical protein